MLSNCGHPINLPVCITQVLTGVAIVCIIVLAGIWCLYFLSRVRELGRKIHYLKKQTEERCYEELTNAKVDYIKSIFIAAISASEVVVYLCVVVIALYHTFVSIELHNCPFPLAYTYEVNSIRVVALLGVSSITVFISLSHILTSYLSHAYAVKRVISLARRDKVLLIWLLIQLIVLWISIAYWRAFLFVDFILAIYLLPIHLYLYIKYSRSLYLLLKRRRLDAWFEDPQLHKRLDGMCKEYKRGSILYVVAFILLELSFIGLLLPQMIDMFFKNSSINCVFFNIKSPLFGQTILKYSGIYEFFRKIFLILTNLVSIVAFFFFFLLHFSIAYQTVKRVVKRRRDYNSYTGTRSHPIYQPLIGTN